MAISLSVKNKMDFVDGSLPKPNESVPIKLKLWIRNNNIVISWLLNSISIEIPASMIYLNTAESIWKELKERFQQSNGPRIFQIKRDLMNLVQVQDSVSIYFTKLKVYWEELANYNSNCTCGLCVCGGAREIEQSMSFLMGLNDTYAQIRGQILLMDPLPSVNKIFSLVIQEERQRDVGMNQANTPMAFNVRSNNNNRYSNSIKKSQNCSNYKNNNKPPFALIAKELATFKRNDIGFMAFLQDTETTSLQMIIVLTPSLSTKKIPQAITLKIP